MPPKSDNWDEMALVGRIARPHGLKGVRPGAEVFIHRAGRVEALTMATVRFHQDRPVIGLRGVEDIDAASALAGSELRVPVEWLATLPEGTFYHHDLVGCSVETRAGDRIGIVSAVEGDSSASRLVVDTPEGEVLVPLAVDICTTIDPAHKRVVVEPPEGLLKLNVRGG